MKTNGQKKDQKRVLATKKVGSVSVAPNHEVLKSATPLQFKHITEGELAASRNAAYSYIVR